MNGCVFAGTFDPITVGHIDIVERARRLFGKVYIAFLSNPNKAKTMFSLEQRLRFAQEATAGMKDVVVESYDGLLVNYCRKVNCFTVVRGVRNGTDLDYELFQANVNMHLSREVDIVLLPTKFTLSHISSSMVRELIHAGGDATSFLPFVLNGEVK